MRFVCWRSCFKVQQAPCAASLVAVPHPAAPTLPTLLQTPKGVRSARFDVVFLDETMRITRGDRVSYDVASCRMGACAAWWQAGGCWAAGLAPAWRPTLLLHPNNSATLNAGALCLFVCRTSCACS